MERVREGEPARHRAAGVGGRPRPRISRPVPRAACRRRVRRAAARDPDARRRRASHRPLRQRRAASDPGQGRVR